jgi:hypothetical protein
LILYTFFDWFLESKPETGPIVWMILAIAFAVILSLLLGVLLMRGFHWLWVFKDGPLRNATVSNERNGILDSPLDHKLKEILSTYDYSLEVPPTEYITCKTDI